MPITRSAKRPASRPSRAARTQPASSKTRAAAPKPARTATPARQRHVPPTPARFPSLWKQLSPERKIDIFGAILALLGLLTLLSLFSANRSAFLGWWIALWKKAFGWGTPLFSLALLLLGVGLIARHVERLPRFSVERWTGIALLLLNLLTILHGLISSSPEAAQAAAQAGKGGGYLGSLLLQGLLLGVGKAATAIVLLAWLMVALALTLDVSVQDMFAWLAGAFKRLRRRDSEQGAITLSSSSAKATPVRLPPPPILSSLQETGEKRVPVSPQEVSVKTGVTATLSVSWILPKASEILDLASTPTVSEEFLAQRARLIEETLAAFNAPCQVVEISKGPVITLFGVEPLFIETRNGRTRVRVSKIVSLADDLALALAAPRIRIQAPVPGQGYVGIEVPNEEMALVTLREVVESEVFQRGRTPLRLALGKDVAGHPVVTNLESLPHLLIAGTTGSGKSVCVNALLSCLLLHNTPDDLRLILIDPKRVELSGYNGIPHLLAPVVVEMERVVGALQWLTREMENRYYKFAEIGARNIADYNARMAAQGGKKLPFLLIVIDELADLMMIAPDETERTITRLAQLARATGIHLVIATQRPSVDVVTGLIKANFPARIAFAVASNTDSRVILDQPGAERLLGRGDMLFQAPDAATPVRLQGVFVSDAEIQRLVEFWKRQVEAASPYAVAAGDSTERENIAASIAGSTPLKQLALFDELGSQLPEDPLYDEAVALVRQAGRCSVSMLQRKLRIGYTRAARLVDAMEEKGIVGPPDAGTGVRAVLDYGSTAPPAHD